jgi:hypothetical protein
MPSEPPSSCNKKVVNSFASFQEMDRFAREKFQVIGQAQAVLREAFLDLDPVFVKMRGMLSQRSEDRVVVDGAPKLPGIRKWWTELCEEFGVAFTFRGFQKRADKEARRTRRLRREHHQEQATEDRRTGADYEQKPGDWSRLCDFVHSECGEKVKDMLHGLSREEATQLLYRVASRLLSMNYRNQ